MSTLSAGQHNEGLPMHPLLYAEHTREELLARIAELERAQAQAHLSASLASSVKPPQVTAPVNTASKIDNRIVTTAESSNSVRHSTTASTTVQASEESSVNILSKNERKKLKKQARAGSPTGRLHGSGTGSLQGDEFFARYALRKIAIRFSYEGWLYGGLALQNDEPLPTYIGRTGSNALPTVEGVLLDALVAARLIKESEKRDLEALQFTRCGRTDRGVSAAGQVISLYVRSQLDESQGRFERGWKPSIRSTTTVIEGGSSGSSTQNSSMSDKQPDIADINESIIGDKSTTRKMRSELPYMSLLNRALPSSIRVLGWSPVDDEFNARFSCQHRHYKYFFTAPDPSNRPLAGGELDIRRMQAAADRLVGEHDFRNLCKVDATKQITNFYRHVMSAHISRASTASERLPPLTSCHTSSIEDPMWVFDLKGSAFLYHQVRHIMAILFLVGNGNEEPSVVDALLNTGYENERPLTAEQPPLDRSLLPVVPSRPTYEMAGDLPLVLWDCAYPAEAKLSWRQDHGYSDGRQSKAFQDMEAEQERQRIKTTISAHFMQSYLNTGNAGEVRHSTENCKAEGDAKTSTNIEPKLVYLGAGKSTRMGKYTPLLRRSRSDLVETVNLRWAQGQGKRRAERKAREVSHISPPS